MVNRHIKNLLLYKLVVVEGRLLREQHERKIHFFRALAKKISWEPCPRKASLERKPISYTQKIIIFLEKKNDDFCFVSASFFVYIEVCAPVFDTSAPIALMELYK